MENHRIREWLYDNVEYCKGIVEDAEKIRETNLQIYPLFGVEINDDFDAFCKAKIALEVCIAIGCSTEDIVVVLEEIGMDKFKCN